MFSRSSRHGVCLSWSQRRAASIHWGTSHTHQPREGTRVSKSDKLESSKGNWTFKKIPGWNSTVTRFQNKEMFLTTPFPKAVRHHVHIHSQASGFAPQAILASHFSKSWMSAELASPLPPLALHSTNSTLRGNCENSNSLPFFPSWAGAALELSSVLGAAERVTRKVLLWGKMRKSQEAKEFNF